MNVLGINLKLPNPKFRKDVIHIQDIKHLLNKCDTSWKGEAFIAGWEISIGFKKGLNNIGIIDLKINESDFMKMEFGELQKITKK